jgi:hypothetical protein
VPGSQPIDESGSDALVQVRRFLMALSDRDEMSASAELSADATYHVPGSSSVGGTFTGRREIVTYFQRLFGFASGSEALKWVDWMVGTDLVSALVETHLQSGLSEFEGQLLFVFSRSPLGGIAAIRLFLEDQARFDRFFAQGDG